MRLHLVTTPHHVTMRESPSGFAAQAARFVEMMSRRGHDIVVHDGAVPIAGSEYDDSTEAWRELSVRALRRIGEDDAPVLAAFGTTLLPIISAFPDRVVEYSVGYIGVAARRRIFLSYAWMHWILGRADEIVARPTDAVIPNFYDPESFPAVSNDGGYLLFAGRAVQDKGIANVLELADRTGMPLVTIGAGEWPEGVYARGFVSTAEKNELMANATAVVAPTTYVEPGASVVNEALMCGTPVIATDWGSFTDAIRPGVDGFRCHDVDDMASALERVVDLDRDAIRAGARARWSYDAVAPLYEAYLEKEFG